MNPGQYLAPRPLAKGGTIGLFAPSGVINTARHEKSVEHLRSLGFKVEVASEASAQYRYFAGTDAERLASFHRMLADPGIDALMMIRGGYGFTRLLSGIDWNLVASSRKLLIGFSDFTVLNCGALAKCNFITIAGPGATIDFGGIDDPAEVQADHAFMEKYCWPVLRGESVEAGPYACAHAYPPTTVSGTLWGSNLSLLSHLVGTPYIPQIEGGILFIEEVDEQPYAVERMFLQLFHAGILQKQRTIVLADFTDCDPQGTSFPYAMEHVVDTLRTLLPIPVLTGLPFGHVARKLTLPYGAQCTLTIRNGEFSLSY